MKNISLIFLLNIFCSQAYSFDGCYKANTDYEGNQNTWTICKLSNNSLSLEIFFSNNLADSDPTTCRETATYLYQNTKLIIKGEKGQCDNGRYLVPHNMECIKSEVGFDCFLENYTYKIKFIKKHNKALESRAPCRSAA